MEVHGFFDSPSPLRLLYRKCMNESIQSVCFGSVSADRGDIVVGSYSGKVFALAQRPPASVCFPVGLLTTPERR